ncbi:hypothetical protein BGZ95_001545 [Linnemannia exigua]|uniref:F-box domain-containing protein n=1 Tax=Linnemannia exigua TaxID=604196 RepID=A0AAD4D6S3_9FUNG|nr:hypothetical protein BGZ95_001545 [Linnemannia exigua]
MANTASTMNPFDLPELRHRISRFFSVKDAVACALVSQSWADDFISVIWFKIDFDVHPRFADLSPDIVSKHGHLIRIVKNAKTPRQAHALANEGVHSLRELRAETSISAIQHEQVYEIVARNNPSLEHLYLFARTATSILLESPTHSVVVSALIPSSSGTRRTSPLKTLRLKYQRLTHDDLIAILQACPKLYELRLGHTAVVGKPTLPFQHEYLKVLGSSLDSLFQVPQHAHSLLSYFPSMTTLAAFSYTQGSLRPPATMVKEEISRYCPQLTGYYLEDSARTIVPTFLTDIVSDVEVVCFLYHHLSLKIINAILLHHSTLKNIKHFNQQTNFDLEKDELGVVTDHFKESGKHLQLIPRYCPALKEFDLPGHEMDMDEVELGTWVCKDLKTLRVRIKGLDTKEKILMAIALWRKGCWQRWQEKAGMAVEAMDDQDPADMSIEARVARHLLKFDKLWSVWLGYQTWNPI